MLIEFQRTTRWVPRYVHSIPLHRKVTNRMIQEKLREIIPWPVKSGDCKDVSGSAVENFFRKALQERSIEKMFALMSMECLKWHTDRIPRMFGAMEDKALANLFNTVSQIVIKIRKETRH